MVYTCACPVQQKEGNKQEKVAARKNRESSITGGGKSGSAKD
jgi:hypothetical protein